MSGLITLRWIADGEEIRSETVPHGFQTIELLEREIEVTAHGRHRLKVRIEFDLPVVCPAASGEAAA